MTSKSSSSGRGRRRALGRRGAQADLHPLDQMIHDIKKPYYARFDWIEYRRRRARFDQLDLADPAVDAVAEAQLVIQAGNDSQHHLMGFSWDAWDPGDGVHVWRARSVTREKARHGYTNADLWEPPSVVAGAGRFNAAGAPLFYGCLSDSASVKWVPWVALREARVNGSGAIFVLMKYTLRSELRLMRVGVPNPDVTLIKRHRAVEREIHQFLVDAIRTPAAHDRGADTYAFTRRLLHEFYPLDDQGRQVGWIYESVKQTGVLNVALPPRAAHATLELRGVVVGQVTADDGTLHGMALALHDATDDVSPYFRDGRIAFPNQLPALPPGQSLIDFLPE